MTSKGCRNILENGKIFFKDKIKKEFNCPEL